MAGQLIVKTKALPRADVDQAGLEQRKILIETRSRRLDIFAPWIRGLLRGALVL